MDQDFDFGLGVAELDDLLYLVREPAASTSALPQFDLDRAVSTTTYLPNPGLASLPEQDLSWYLRSLPDASAAPALPGSASDYDSIASSSASAGAATPPPPFPSAPSVALAFAPASGEKRLRSCAACRIRRIRCERKPGGVDCTKCIEKGLSCTPMPVTARKPPVRSGKRIEQARALFGADGQQSNGAAKRARLDEVGAYGVPEANLDPTNAVVGRLVTTELEGNLSAALLDLYFLLPQARLPLLQGTNFKMTFEAANRRMSEMDDQAQVLFAVIIALASRVSDHPLLIGGGAPSISALAVATVEGRDMSEYGKRRETACEALTAKAMAMADSAGVWRKATPMNIATLLVLEGLWDHHEMAMPTTNRPYADAYMSHLRVLLEQGLSDEVMDTGLGWTCFMRDGAASAHSGRRPGFSDDDVLLLGDAPAPLATAMRSPELDTNVGEMNLRRKPFWDVFSSFMIHLAHCMRDCPARLTGLRARRHTHLDEGFARDLLHRLDLAAEAVPILEHRATMFLGPASDCSDVSKGKWGFVRALRIARCSLVLLLNRIVKHRFEARLQQEPPRLTELSDTRHQTAVNRPADDDTEYWGRLERLYHETHARAFSAAREIVDMLMLNLDSGISLGVMSGAQLLFARLPFWVPIILGTPTSEEGGPAGFTFENKLSDLRCILRALGSIGWSFERLSRPIPWLRREVEALESRQAAYLRKALSDLTESSPVVGLSPSTSSDDQLSDEEINQMLEEMTAGLFGDLGQAPGQFSQATGVTRVSRPSAFVPARSPAVSRASSSSPTGHEDNAVISMLAHLLG